MATTRKVPSILAKFHPYSFGAKDDVGVLVPKQKLNDLTLLYIAALLNRMTWRHSYGRKCFRSKLLNVGLDIPTTQINGKVQVDESCIAAIYGRDYNSRLPYLESQGVSEVPNIEWSQVPIRDIFNLRRGDFHSIKALAEGPHLTVSRTSEDNGVVGKFELPDGATIYKAGLLTVSTVSGDAFVQMNEFIVTDNVVVCTPKDELNIESMFFIAFILNYQKWRYGYGRQCYLSKLARVTLWLPVKQGSMDQETVKAIVRQASYWDRILSNNGIESHIGKPLDLGT